MLRVGLTGGIASGKSTASRCLADLGAVVVDADAIARRLQEPGRSRLRGRGRALRGPRGGQGHRAPDRAARSGRIVFADEARLAGAQRHHAPPGAGRGRAARGRRPPGARAREDIPPRPRSRRARDTGPRAGG
ncbi:dephospho-CoA kinase [Kocuria rhizophila]|nr:dephospho-CoA kinase [Kocuria rhizophila]